MIKPLRLTMLTVFAISFNQLPGADKDRKKEVESLERFSAYSEFYKKPFSWNDPAFGHDDFQFPYEELPTADKDLKKEVERKEQQSKLYKKLLSYKGCKYTALSPDDSLFAVGADECVYIYNMAYRLKHKNKSQKTPTILVHGSCNSQVMDLAFRPDGQILGTLVRENKYVYISQIILWNLATKQKRSLEQINGINMLSLNFSNDSSVVIGGNDDNSIIAWDTTTGAYLASMNGHKHWVNTAKFSPNTNNRTFASAGSHDCTAKVWDITTLQETANLNHPKAVMDLAYNHDGSLLVTTAGKEALKIWDLRQSEEVATLKGYEHWINSIAVSPDLTIASADNGTVKTWCMRTYKLLDSFPSPCKSLAFNSADTILVAGSTLWEKKRMWNKKTNAKISKSSVEKQLAGNE